MKCFSAQYIITNSGPPLKRAVVTTEDDGEIISVEDTGGSLEEKRHLEFYNGIIIPGFVNCHAHLELSHMKGSVPRGTGLGNFINEVIHTRDIDPARIIDSARSADNDMFNAGIVLCADVCNNSLTFNIKEESLIRYISLIEVFGLDPGNAGRRMDDAMKAADAARGKNLKYSLVPHSAYSVSVPLFRLLRGKTNENRVTSIHFMESAGEKEFLENHSGPLMETYKQSGIVPDRMETVSSHAEAVLNEITLSGNLLVVHNTFTDRKTIIKVKNRKNIFWCLCTNSNIFIENRFPPLDLLLEEGCKIVTGTDSLASNSKLDILEELKTLQANFPALSIKELVSWATINGAEALGEEDNFGKIEKGKKPGLLLLQNIDLINMKFLPQSFVTRLI
jgi:aminodeoxyfutalosine deaminase